MSEAPLIELEQDGTAPVVRYDIPEPTGYEGKNFIELTFDDEIFTDGAGEPPRNAVVSRPAVEPRALPLSASTQDQVRTEVLHALRTGTSRRPELPNRPIFARRRADDLDDIAGGGTPIGPGGPGTSDHPPVDEDDLDGMVDQIGQGWHVVQAVDVSGAPFTTTVPVPAEPDPHLYLVETLRMTTFLGDYGAGRIVKTFTLLPGEVTRISVKTYRQRESTRKSASSVLDSLTEESAADLQTSLMSEQSDQTSFQKTQEYYAEGTASAGWGWGSASVKAGAKSSTNAAREESVKNVSNATEKHSSRASAKRQVEINTSYEVSEKSGEETSIIRDIENINLSRTLNFVFRQMNQEFVTLIHLTDVRLGFFNGYGASRREVPISAIDDLLAVVVKQEHRESVRESVLEQLSAVRDVDGLPVDVVKTVEITPGDTYRHFDPDLVATHTDGGDTFVVPGVLLKVDRRVMRTEGVVVESLLGNGPALDEYAQQLQELEVRRRAAEVAREEADADRRELVNQIIRDGDADLAEIAEGLVCGCTCCCGCEGHRESGTDPDRPGDNEPGNPPGPRP